MSGGMKFDQEKPRTDLLDPDALLGTAAVLGFGAKKYADNNWKKGIAYSRILGALLRHTFAIMRGEDTDAESGLPHVDHLACEAMFLQYMMRSRKDLDDRFKPEVKKAVPYESIPISCREGCDCPVCLQRMAVKAGSLTLKGRTSS